MKTWHIILLALGAVWLLGGKKKAPTGQAREESSEPGFFSGIYDAMEDMGADWTSEPYGTPTADQYPEWDLPGPADYLPDESTFFVGPVSGWEPSATPAYDAMSANMTDAGLLS